MREPRGWGDVVRRLALRISVLAAATGCNTNGSGDCPAKSSIQPGAACNDDQLQCAYDLSTPSLACDGTTTVIPSSCTCTSGAWACPSPVDCDAGGSAGDDGSAAGDGAGE